MLVRSRLFIAFIAIFLGAIAYTGAIPSKPVPNLTVNRCISLINFDLFAALHIINPPFPGFVSVCYCQDGPTLSNFLSSNNVAIFAIQSVGFGAVQTLFLNLLAAQGQQCFYPDFSIPLCMPGSFLGNPCAFTCQGGLQLCPGPSGLTCQQSCPTGVTRRSPEQQRIAADSRCPTGWEVCGGPTSATAFECIDTRKTLDSCGGCLFPFGGKKATGTDCSAIHGADGVSCRNGRCFVESCTAGMTVSKDGQSCE